MGDFQEKRRAKRVPIDLRLKISNLFRQDNEMVQDVQAPIEVVNISKSGVGFLSSATLPLGYYFNARLRLNERSESDFYCVVKIIREQKREDGMNLYGCEFIGVPSILEYIFEELEAQMDA